MFLFSRPNKDLMPWRDGTMPMRQNKSILLELLRAEEQSRSMVVLLLILVVLLHVWLGLWLLNSTQSLIEVKPLKVMEVTLLAAPSQKSVTAAQSAPKPLPSQKPPVKKPAKKKMPVIKKPAELPKPQPAVEAKPPFLPSEPLVKSAATEAKPVAEKAANEQAKGKAIVSGIAPLVRVQPRYPSRAVGRHIEGWVKIEFTITTAGTVTDTVVVAAQPAEIFDYEALKAIKKWKFKEKRVNGVAAEQRAVQTLQFKLTD